MQFIALFTLLILAILAACINAGRVTINGVCVDCNKPTTRAPQSHRGYSGRSYGQYTTARPRKTSRRPAHDDDWNLYQNSNGAQYMSMPRW